MRDITVEDQELVDIATAFIKKRCDDDNHTVGCALRTADGTVYRGINMDGIHSICGEQSAISSAYVDGATDVRTIVAIGYFDGVVQPLTPCGTCRQFMSKYTPDVEIIIGTESGLKKCTLEEMLPYAYKRHVDKNGN